MTATITALVARVAMDTSAVSAGSAQVRKEAATVSRVFRGMESETSKLERKVAALYGQYKRGAIGVGEYERALEHLQRQQMKSTKETQKNTDTVVSGNNSIANSIKSLAAAYISFQGIKTGVAIASDMEQASISFEVMTGSAQAGKKILGELRQFAASTPITLSGAQQAARTLLAFGESVDSVVPTMRTIGNIAAGDSERFKSLSLAFAQTQAAGRLMGQEVLQMTNAGFNPLQEMSQRLNISVPKLKKAMEQGKISADMVRESFAALGGETGRLGNFMDRMSKTALGSYNQLLSTIQEIIATSGEVFLPILARVAKSMDNVLKSAKTLAGGLNETQVKMLAGVAAFSATLMIIPRIIAAFKAIVVATKAMTAAQITALAFSGPKGWAQLAAGAAVAAATVYAVGQSFDDYADSVGNAQSKVESLASSQGKMEASNERQKKQLSPIVRSYEKMKYELGEQTKLARLGEDTYRSQKMLLSGFHPQQIQTIQHMHDQLKLIEMQKQARQKEQEEYRQNIEKRKQQMEQLAEKGKSMMERNNPVLAVGKQLSELQVLLRVNAIDQATFFKERNKILKESVSKSDMPEASAIEIGSAEFVRQMAGQFNQEGNAQIQKLEEQRLLQEAQLVAQKETNRRLQEMGITKRIQS